MQFRLNVVQKIVLAVTLIGMGGGATVSEVPMTAPPHFPMHMPDEKYCDEMDCITSYGLGRDASPEQWEVAKERREQEIREFKTPLIPFRFSLGHQYYGEDYFKAFMICAGFMLLAGLFPSKKPKINYNETSTVPDVPT